MPINPEQDNQRAVQLPPRTYNAPTELTSDVIFDRLGASAKEELEWSGTFGELLEKLKENPERAGRNAAGFLLEAVTSDPNYEKSEYALYGAEKPIRMFTEVCQSAADGLPIGKRIILALGPPGGGKSTFVNYLKSRLEAYSRTPEGAIYAIADCPMHESPLHLLSKDIRKPFTELTGIHVEGTLCPHCQAKYGKIKPQDIKDIPVKRIFLFEQTRTGICTYKPGDPKGLEMADLIGEVNISKLAEFGDSADPRAFNLNGELEQANQGIMELVEFFKLPNDFLHLFLDLTQDKVIKAPRFPNIYTDTVLFAHTNQAEYDHWVKEAKNEGLKDRVFVIAFPYNLRMTDEKRIYEKLIGQSTLEERVKKRGAKHLFAPATLENAALFAVLSRMSESTRGVPRVVKAKAYDGQNIDGVNRQEVEELKREFEREGMTGISPRYVIDQLSLALNAKKNTECMTPIDALIALQNGLDSHPHTRDMDKKQKEAIRNLIADVRGEYDAWVREEIQEAFVPAFQDHAKALADKYLHELDLLLGSKVKDIDPITNKEIPVDEKFLRGLEEQINISDSGKNEFRQQVWNAFATAHYHGGAFDYRTYAPLKKAIEVKITAELKNVIRATVASPSPNVEEKKRLTDVEKHLIDEKGYCPHCAGKLIHYASMLFNQ